MKMEKHRTTFPDYLILRATQTISRVPVLIWTEMDREDNRTFHQVVFGPGDELVSVEVQAGDGAVVAVQDHQALVRLQVPAPAGRPETSSRRPARPPSARFPSSPDAGVQAPGDHQLLVLTQQHRADAPHVSLQHFQRSQLTGHVVQVEDQVLGAHGHQGSVPVVHHAIGIFSAQRTQRQLLDVNSVLQVGLRRSARLFSRTVVKYVPQKTFRSSIRSSLVPIWA